MGKATDEERIAKEVIDRITKERLRLQISQNQLAKLAGVSRSGIRHLEGGETSPTLHFLLRVCRALNIRLTTVIRDAERGTVGES